MRRLQAEVIKSDFVQSKIEIAVFPTILWRVKEHDDL